MTVIAIEGASAVGKSTVCRILEAEFGFSRIPEVNELFSRGVNPTSSWYFERQLERWQMACAVSKAGGRAVLDGDPLQPVWYNWIFTEAGLQPISAVIEFYKQQFRSGRMQFPEKYYLLTATESELHRRKAADTTRTRRNFVSHLRLIKPQVAYFQTMNMLAPGRSAVLESNDPMLIARHIANDVVISQQSDAELFDSMSRFISRNSEEYQ